MIIEPPTVKSKSFATAIKQGTRLIIQLQVNGVPEPTYIWQKNGFVLPNEYQSHGSALVIDNVNKTHTGTYSCMLSNLAGSLLWMEATVFIKDN